MNFSKKIICCDCGKETACTPNKKRCSDCSLVRKRLIKKPYAKENKKRRRKSGVHCSRCAKPTGKRGICDACSVYVLAWKKANPQLVSAARQKRHFEGRDSYGKLLAELLAKQKFKCALCGVKAEKWHLDHKIPVSLGGCSEAFNFQVLCVWCNLHKGAKIIDQDHDERQLRLVA